MAQEWIQPGPPVQFPMGPPSRNPGPRYGPHGGAVELTTGQLVGRDNPLALNAFAQRFPDEQRQQAWVAEQQRAAQYREIQRINEIQFHQYQGQLRQRLDSQQREPLKLDSRQSLDKSIEPQPARPLLNRFERRQRDAERRAERRKQVAAARDSCAAVLAGMSYTTEIGEGWIRQIKARRSCATVVAGMSYTTEIDDGWIHQVRARQLAAETERQQQEQLHRIRLAQQRKVQLAAEAERQRQAELRRVQIAQQRRVQRRIERRDDLATTGWTLVGTVAAVAVLIGVVSLWRFVAAYDPESLQLLVVRFVVGLFS